MLFKKEFLGGHSGSANGGHSGSTRAWIHGGHSGSILYIMGGGWALDLASATLAVCDRLRSSRRSRIEAYALAHRNWIATRACNRLTRSRVISRHRLCRPMILGARRSPRITMVLSCFVGLMAAAQRGAVTAI
jgi:hypothetical protein